MLRMLVVQRALNLSDEECEDQCTGSRALSSFLGAAKVPDKTTLCNLALGTGLPAAAPRNRLAGRPNRRAPGKPTRGLAINHRFPNASGALGIWLPRLPKSVNV